MMREAWRWISFSGLFVGVLVLLGVLMVLDAVEKVILWKRRRRVRAW